MCAGFFEFFSLVFCIATVTGVCITTNRLIRNFLKIFHAGTIIHDEKVKVTSGRILTINVIAKDKDTAVKIAYENIRKIKAYEDKDFQKENNSLIFFREDIGN